MSGNTGGGARGGRARGRAAAGAAARAENAADTEGATDAGDAAGAANTGDTEGPAKGPGRAEGPIARLRRVVGETVGGLPRQFWWLWTSTLVTRLGTFVATFLALYLTAERGYSASYAGLVGALYGLGGVVGSVCSGVLTDRIGRRPTMLTAQVTTAVTVASLAFMEHPVAIALVAGVVGLATNATQPAVQAMMADVVAPEHRVRAFALNYWALNLGVAVSSTLAGLIARFSYHLLFFTEAGMVLVCAVLVFLRLPETRPQRPDAAGAPAAGQDGGAAPVGETGEAGKSGEIGKAGKAAEARVSLWTVLRDGPFMAVVGLWLVLATIIQQAFVALPISMGKEGFSSAEFGAAVAVNGLLIVALQMPITRLIEHRDPVRLLVVSSLLIGYGFGLQAFAGSVAFYMVAIAVWTLGEIINSPTQMGLVVRLSPTHGRGRYQGVFSLSWSFAALSTPLLSGVVIDRFGADTLWTASAVLGTVAAVGYAVLLRGVRERGAPRPAGAPRAEPAGAEAGPEA